MNKLGWKLCLTVLVVFLATGGLGLEHAANFQLKCGWLRRNNILLPMSEFAAEFGPAVYWDFVNEFSACQEGETDEQLHHKATAHLSERLKSERELPDMLDLSLAIRFYSARLELFHGLGNESLQNGESCLSSDNFISIDGISVCNSEDLSAKLAEDADKKNSEYGILGDDVTHLHHFDHIYEVECEGGLPKREAILYGNMGSPEFREYHDILTQAAEECKISYILRPYEYDASSSDGLQGYGIELFIKSTEYNVQDDRKREGATAMSDSETAVADDESAVNLVSGFDFSALQSRYPAESQNLESFRAHLEQKTTEIEALSVWELQDLGIQATSSVLNSEEPLRSLRDLVHNFPSSAKAISAMEFAPEIREALEDNGALFNTFKGIVLNGVPLDIEDISPFTIYEVLLEDAKDIIHSRLIGIDLEEDETAPEATSEDSPAVNLDLPEILYINSLKGPEYNHFPRQARAILQETRLPVPNVAIDFFTLTAIVDPMTKTGLDVASMLYRFWKGSAPFHIGIAVVESNSREDGVSTEKFEKDIARRNLEALCANEDEALELGEICTKLAILSEENGSEDSQSEDGSGMTRQMASKLFYYLAYKENLEKAMQFLLALGAGGKNPDQETVVNASIDVAYLDPKLALGLAKRRTVKGKPLFEYVDHVADVMKEKRVPINSAYLNGKPVDASDIYRSLIGEHLAVELKLMREHVQRGEIDDDTEVFKYLMGLPGVADKASRMNSNFGSYGSANVVPVDPLAGYGSGMVSGYSTPELFYSTDAVMSRHPIALRNAQSSAEKVTLLFPDKFYLKGGGDADMSTEWLMFDWYRVSSVNTAATFLEKTSDHVLGRRMAILPMLLRDHQAFCPLCRSSTNPNVKALGQRVINVFARLSEYAAFPEALKFAASVLKLHSAYLVHEAASNETQGDLMEQVWSVMQKIGVEKYKISSELFGTAPTLGLHMQVTAGLVQYLCSAYPKPLNGSVLLFKNGKPYNLAAGPWEADRIDELIDGIFRPLSAPKSDEIGDMELGTRIQTARNANRAKRWWWRKLLGTISSNKETVEVNHLGIYTNRGADADESAWVEVYAVLDTLSREAQKASSILLGLERMGASVDVVFLPKMSVSEMPLKSYYRYVFSPKISFRDQSGELVSEPGVYFANLPQKVLFSTTVHTPRSWQVTSVVAKYDIDNMRMTELEDDERIMYTEFVLENLVVEGIVVDRAIDTLSPSAGLPIRISRRDEEYQSIVWSGGYFQIRANPGTWRFSPAGGAEALYEQESTDKVLVVDRLDNVNPKILLGRKDEHSKVQLTDFLYSSTMKEPFEGSEGGKGEGAAGDESIVGKVKSTGKYFSKLVGISPEGAIDKDEVINIFSIASGHLYERFIKIMMLSVVKQTKNPVKFWFIKQFLSPQFKESIDQLADHFGFDYELVTFQWPKHIYPQTEKQRVIWAYKILFLDVLFPLDVKRIIFIDADQVTRIDMSELSQMDLKGYAAAMTPMGDTNPAVEGYRFWKTGFWKNHLRGRSYHISALFTIDMHMFRRMKAPDLYRETYSSLSKDSQSLSNLDQDLPNFLQDEVPILSLPSNWLWCETWCSMESKQYAKTIDLCNNPLTKRPKLEAAKLFIEEWEDYDSEIYNFEMGLTASPVDGNAGDQGVNFDTTIHMEHV